MTTDGKPWTAFAKKVIHLLCGLHALNNALGQNFLTAEDMADACDAYITEMAMDGMRICMLHAVWIYIYIYTYLPYY